MDIEQLTGWTASALLCATLVNQVWKQVRERSCEGVSRFLFIGQLLASILFLAYSIMTGNAVFIVSNGFLVLAALVGQVVLIRNRRLRAAAGGCDQETATGQAQARVLMRGSRSQ